jgi:pimeloyl-ACP methyl ester carboxylesterase
LNVAPIPFVDFGGSGRSLVFLHGNGYPPACYGPLLSNLAAGRYHPLAMLLRPLWAGSVPGQINSWNAFSDDLLSFLAQEAMVSAIAIGHSAGATAILRAALAAPARFGALVLIEPVLLPRRVMLEWWLARAFGLAYLVHPLIRASARRRTQFDDLGQLFAGYRRRKIFRYFSDASLRIFIEGMTKPGAHGGYELAYSSEWETRVYYTGIWNDWDLWRGIARLDVPTLILRGAESDTFRESAARAVSKKNPRIQIAILEHATHLAPLEKPGEVFERINGFLSGANPSAA